MRATNAARKCQVLQKWSKNESKKKKYVSSEYKHWPTRNGNEKKTKLRTFNRRKCCAMANIILHHIKYDWSVTSQYFKTHSLIYRRILKRFLFDISIVHQFITLPKVNIIQARRIRIVWHIREPHRIWNSLRWECVLMQSYHISFLFQHFFYHHNLKFVAARFSLAITNTTSRHHDSWMCQHFSEFMLFQLLAEMYFFLFVAWAKLRANVMVVIAKYSNMSSTLKCNTSVFAAHCKCV